MDVIELVVEIFEINNVYWCVIDIGLDLMVLVLIVFVIVGVG